MRVALLAAALLCAAAAATIAEKITEDPNAGTSLIADTLVASNAPAEARVTISARRQTVSAILAELSEQSGIILKAGISQNDWQVRDRRMNVYCKNLPLSNLMNSIARVMNYKWTTEKPQGGKPVYRLCADRKAVLEEERLRAKERDAVIKWRTDALALYAKAAASSPEKLVSSQKLQFHKPEEIIEMAKLFSDFLAAAPDVARALAEGRSVDIPAGSLSPEAMRLLVESAVKMPDFDLLASTRPGPFDVDQIVRDRDRMTVQVNPNPDRTRVTESVRTCLGEIRVTGTGKNRLWLNVLNPGGFSLLGTDKPQGEAPPEEKNAVPDDPILRTKVKISTESNELPDVQLALSEASGCAIVSDSFARAMGRVEKDTEITLGDVLAQIGSSYKYHWEMHGSTIEFRDRKWFVKRAALVPEASLERWRKALRGTGTLGLDDLAEIALLTQEQFDENIRDDEVFKAAGFVLDFYGQKEILRLYGALTPQQKAAVFTESGLDLRALTPQQWANVDSLLKGRESRQDWKPDTVLTLTGRRDDRDEITGYRFRIAAAGTRDNIEFHVLTPLYVKGDKRPPGSVAEYRSRPRD